MTLSRIITKRRSVFSLVVLFTLLLTGFSVQAADYRFPGLLPDGCAGPDASGNYNCGVVGLSANDTVTITVKPITIIGSGAFSMGSGVLINKGGNAADLHLVLAGALSVGATAQLMANVTSSQAVNIAAGGVISGTITTTTATGIVATEATTRVGGAITAGEGAVSIGASSQVNGFINAGVGAVSIGANSTIDGGITAAIGAVTLGADSQVKGDVAGGLGAVTSGMGVVLGSRATPGNITTTDGIVAMGSSNRLGSVTTGLGAITIGADSAVDSLTTQIGVVTIGARVSVSGDIISGVGAVNVGTNSHVCGDVSISGAGIVTLATLVKIGGGVSSTSGAIIIGTLSTVGKDITATSGILTITSTLVGGNITTTSGIINLTDTSIRGKVSTASGIITWVSSYDNLTDLVIPDACPVTPLVPIIDSTATGLFDCVEVDSSRPALYTKLAGTAFTIAVIALKTDKTLENNYVLRSGTPKYTRVELFDDSATPASCANYANPPVAKQVVFFTGNSAGRTQAEFKLPQAYKKLRCRVTECLDSTCTTVAATAAQSCSSDEFAVRPVAVTLSTLEAKAVAPSEKSMPIVKAGANFTLSAVTTITTITDNYFGALTLDTGKLTAQNPAQATMSEIGGVVGTLTPTLTANTKPSLATYSEVGYLYLAAGAYRDDDFTQVDSINGKNDCIAGSLSDNLSGGQYGCSIGNAVAVTLGRFTPDHFDITGTVVTRSDLQTVESQTLPFTYMNEPMQLGLKVTAYNNSEGVTQNYRGAFASLNTSNWNLANWTCTNLNQTQCMGLSASNGNMLLTDRLAIDTTSVNSAAPTNTPWSNGSSDFTANITLKRSASPNGPYDALKLGAKPQDSDGVTLPPNAATDTTHCVNLNAVTGAEDQNCTFVSADETVLRRKLFETRVRFGRLNLTNASGSQLQALPVPVELQYWNGSSFAINADDNLTSLINTNIVSGNYQGSLSTIATPSFRTADANGSCSADSPLSAVITGGKSCLLFGKPSASGSFDMLVNLGSAGSPANCLKPALAYGTDTATLGYLSGNWCGTAYDRDPSAHVTFGIYKENSKGINHLIYFRERY